jgi:hypothetical protein
MPSCLQYQYPKYPLGPNDFQEDIEALVADSTDARDPVREGQCCQEAGRPGLSFWPGLTRPAGG